MTHGYRHSTPTMWYVPIADGLIAPLSKEMTMQHRAKGYRSEHELEQRLRAAGIDAKRIPMSGQAAHTGDIMFNLFGRDHVAEVKAYRQNFFEYKLLEHSAVVFKRTIRPGRTMPFLVVMSIEMFLRLALAGTWKRYVRA